MFVLFIYHNIPGLAEIQLPYAIMSSPRETVSPHVVLPRPLDSPCPISVLLAKTEPSVSTGTALDTALSPSQQSGRCQGGLTKELLTKWMGEPTNEQTKAS